MEATSLISAAPKPRRAPAPQAGFPNQPPPIGLPLLFVVTGLCALVGGLALLVARPGILAAYHYNQYVLSVTHIFTLGWISSIIMGAMYQLVPVALETHLYSQRLARWQFGFHAVGAAGMVWSFWVWHPTHLGHFAAVMAVGVLLFVYNVARTLARVANWNVVATGITAAVGWFLATMLAGLYLTASKCWNFSPFNPLVQMHAHAHLGALGFFIMMIVAVSYKLAPMFLLSELQSLRRARWSVALLNLGTLGVFVTILLSSPLKLAFALVSITALALYGWEMLAIWRARKRRQLDWGLVYFFTALGMLVPLCASALLLCWPGLSATRLMLQLETGYGFLALFGVTSLAILGMLYKIVPFLVWFSSYSKHVGRARTPALAELYSESLQAISYWLLLAGIAGTFVSILLADEVAVRRHCWLLAAGVVLFLINMGKILVHLFRPRISPLKAVPQMLRARPAQASIS